MIGGQRHRETDEEFASRCARAELEDWRDNVLDWMIFGTLSAMIICGGGLVIFVSIATVWRSLQ
jgi:hypothetical protein